MTNFTIAMAGSEPIGTARLEKVILALCAPRRARLETKQVAGAPPEGQFFGEIFMGLNGAAAANEEPFFCNCMVAPLTPFHGHICGWMQIPHHSKRNAIARGISIASACLGCTGRTAKLKELVQSALVWVHFGVCFGSLSTFGLPIQTGDVV